MRVNKTQRKPKSNLPHKDGKCLPGPGRPEGSKNKNLPWLNDAIEIYQQRGGKKWMNKWIDASAFNLREFMKTILAIAVKQVTEQHEHSGQIDGKHELTIRVIQVEDKNGNGNTHQ